MNQKEASQVKDLAKDTVEALRVVTEKECPECKGTGYDPVLSIQHYTEHTLCNTCGGTGKVRWKWEPKVGEWVIFLGGKKQEITLITDYIKSDPLYAHIKHAVWMQVKRLIPILPWEELERVLQGAGKWCWLKRNGDLWEAEAGRGGLDGSKKISGKSRQEAVMRAVIKLGKEKINAPHPHD